MSKSLTLSTSAHDDLEIEEAPKEPIARATIRGRDPASQNWCTPAQEMLDKLDAEFDRLGTHFVIAENGDQLIPDNMKCVPMIMWAATRKCMYTQWMTHQPFPHKYFDMEEIMTHGCVIVFVPPSHYVGNLYAWYSEYSYNMSQLRVPKLKEHFICQDQAAHDMICQIIFEDGMPPDQCDY